MENKLEILREIYQFFLYIDDVHIDNEDDNYSYQSNEYLKNLDKLKKLLENDPFIKS